MSLWSFWSVWLLLVAMTGTNAQADDSGSECLSVLITNDLPKALYFKTGEPTRLECAARGDPSPRYHWQRNGKTVLLSDNDPRVYMMPENGTLVFARPGPGDAGVYQCFASNDNGVDVTRKVSFEEAVLEDFPPSLSQTHTPKLGESFSLPCSPPKSVPKGILIWVIRDEHGDFRPAESPGRVMMDGDYNLHFTNIIIDDEKEQPYMCMFLNQELQQTTFGPSHYIRLPGDRERDYPVTLQWASPENLAGVRGESLSIKCIFGGNPTPKVYWQRTDGRPMSNRVTLSQHEMIIDELDRVDAGRYECFAENAVTQNRVSRIFRISVDTKPYFTHRPRNVQTGSGGMAQFYCGADGRPKPHVSWFINGKPLDTDSTPMSHIRQPNENTLEIEQLGPSHSMIVQCNASNVHGSDTSSASLCVNADAPTIIKPPEREVKEMEGREVTLTCQATSAIPHHVTWLKDTSEVKGSRFQVLPNEGLRIKSARKEDEGHYRCVVANSKFRTTSRESVLTVCQDSDCMNSGSIFTISTLLVFLGLLDFFLCCYIAL